MKRCSFSFKVYKFKSFFVTLILSFFCILFSNTFGAIIGTSLSEYYSRLISSSQKPALLIQECKGVNFLQNNDFYIGYEFNYFFTTNYIKTFFEADFKGHQFYFFSSNTGMTAEKYLAPNICGLEIIHGESFSEDWQENECYITQDLFDMTFGDVEFNYQSFKLDTFEFTIKGIVSNDSLVSLDGILNNDKIFVSYSFALKNLYESYKVISSFEKNDYVGNKRYLDHYFARYLNSNWKNTISVAIGNNMTIDVSSQQIINNPLPFSVSFIAIIILVLLLFLHKRELMMTYLSFYNRYLFFITFPIISLVNILLAKFYFISFSFVLTSKAVMISIISFVFVVIILNYFKDRFKKVYKAIENKNVHVIRI